MVLPVLLMVGLATAGLATLRRQVAEEFPDVTTADVAASLRGGASGALHAVSAARHGDAAPPAAAPAPAAPAPGPTRLEQLERLTALHRSGALSDEEFAAEKTLVSREEAVR